MAAAGESDEDPPRDLQNGGAEDYSARTASQPPNDNADEGSGNEEEEEDDDEREPTLKYTKLTSYLASIYRNGDSTSSLQVSGDKLITGTHNGIVHVLSIPSLRSLRQYGAHSSSVTAISISPFSPSLVQNVDAPPKTTGAQYLTPKREPVASPAAPRSSPGRQSLPSTASNLVYIATASIDGHVCVSSLVDPKDVTLRNFARPIHAVALSPSYKTDRTYLSGGTAGNLICTVGGKAGVRLDANTNSAAAAASGWLGSIGLGSSSGKDIILHSGEGTVTAIQWSTTGKYVAWNNEFGTRIMHSHLEAEDTDLAWKRVGHVGRPNLKEWEDMAGVWKAQTQWIETKYIEQDTTDGEESNGAHGVAIDIRPNASPAPAAARQGKKRVERLLVGWGSSVWTIHVTAGTPTQGRPRPTAKAEMVHHFPIDDCIISGITLYTPSILVALCFRTVDDEGKPVSVADPGTPRRGRHNSLAPELRLIDLDSAHYDELEAESVVVSRFERLSFADYHLSSLYIPKSQAPIADQKGALEILGGGLREVGASATRLFSSSASILSGSSGDQTTVGSMSPPGTVGQMKYPPRETLREVPRALLTTGLKIFIQSPFDCVVAFKRDIGDRLDWLMEREDFEAAWKLVTDHPEIVTSSRASDSRPSTPTRSNASLADFFDDSASQSTVGASRTAGSGAAGHGLIKAELQRIGDLWVNKLVEASDWAAAGTVAGKTLGSSRKWEDWILLFAKHNHFDEITPFIPTDRLKPALPPHVYEVVLGHYITHDRLQLEELLAKWSTSMFDVTSIVNHIESYLDLGEVRPDSVEGGLQGRDWRILLNALAKLYLADARPAEAVHCYLKTKNSDAALEVIRDYGKIDAVAEDVYTFILIRITPKQEANAPDRQLDELSSEPIRLLAAAAVQGTIEAPMVISQLQDKAPASNIYLFFYFRELWRPSDSEAVAPARNTAFVRRSRFTSREDTAETPSRMLLSPYADEVVTLFAEFSQQLLNDFLKVSKDYTFEHASDECRRRHYIPELVYLLSETGQTRSALHMIIDELQDFAMAITFVRDVDEESLWSDLLDYSMDKPDFIRGLLEDLGTSLDPIALVKRIPEGLRIEGLKGSLAKLVRESEITWSISAGASRIMRGEIASNMDRLRRGRERGFVYDVVGHQHRVPDKQQSSRRPGTSPKTKQGTCVSCHTSYSRSEETSATETDDHLIGFGCGHMYHLSCFIDNMEDNTNKDNLEKLQRQLLMNEADADGSVIGVGTKVKQAQMVKAAIGKLGCLSCGPDKFISLTG